jgi:hypothetical protein
VIDGPEQQPSGRQAGRCRASKDMLLREDGQWEQRATIVFRVSPNVMPCVSRSLVRREGTFTLHVLNTFHQNIGYSNALVLVACSR